MCLSLSKKYGSLFSWETDFTSWPSGSKRKTISLLSFSRFNKIRTKRSTSSTWMLHLNMQVPSRNCFLNSKFYKFLKPKALMPTTESFTAIGSSLVLILMLLLWICFFTWSVLNDLKFITLGYVDSKLASDREVKASTDLLAPSWGRQMLNLLFFIELENC
jgi:hypothetical protein